MEAEADHLLDSLVRRSVIGHEEISTGTWKSDVNRPRLRTSKRPKASGVRSRPLGFVLCLGEDEQVDGTSGCFLVLPSESSRPEHGELVVHVPNRPGRDLGRGGDRGPEGRNDEGKARESEDSADD